MAKQKSKAQTQAQITKAQQARAVAARAAALSAAPALKALGQVSMSINARWQLLASVAIFSVLIYHIAPILTPFATAALFAYLGDPAVDRLEARGFRIGAM